MSAQVVLSVILPCQGKQIADWKLPQDWLAWSVIFYVICWSQKGSINVIWLCFAFYIFHMLASDICTLPAPILCLWYWLSQQKLLKKADDLTSNVAT